MNFPAQEFIEKRLQQRQEEGNLRVLSTQSLPVDFYSNDYLGFAKNDDLQLRVAQLASELHLPLGATGSRLLSGNSKLAEDVEQQIAKYHQAYSALFFNSGYDANLGIFSSLPQKGDTVVCDEFIHACIIDGIRLSYAQRYSFKHNDLDSLEQKLHLAKGNVYIAVESIYSMDGDQAPLREILNLANQYQAQVIVDEAHAIGVLGKQGRGLVCALGLENEVFARVVTFGKAMGSHGAAVLGSEKLRQYLINFSRSFIFTTATTPHTLVGLSCAYRYLSHTNAISTLHSVIAYYQQKVEQLKLAYATRNNSSIQSIQIGGNVATKQLALALQKIGLDVRPILHPTVPIGKERLRICLHAYNTFEEIDTLLEFISGYDVENC